MTAMYFTLNSVSTFRITVVNSSGNMEYPRMDSDWKYPILPPKALMLKLTNPAPAIRAYTIAMKR